MGRVKTVPGEKSFEVFKLSQLFATEAATELVNIKHRLVSLHAGKEPIPFSIISSKRRIHEPPEFVNSWQTAMYRALATDRTFCEVASKASDL